MNCFNPITRAVLGSVALTLVTNAALAAPYQLLVQSRQNTSAPGEVYRASFDTLDDVFTGTIGASAGFTQIEVTADYRISGLAFDGAYRMLVQSRANTAAPYEVYMAGFDTLGDIDAGNVSAASGFTQLEVTADFRIAGLAYDGSYRLLLESRQDTAAPYEVYVASFATLADVFSGTLGGSTGFSQLAVSSAYQIADFTYDGSYRLMLQSRQDADAPNEVYVASFDTLDDVFAAQIGSATGFTQISVAADYEIVGFTSEWLPPTAPVPEPGTVLLLALGLAGVGVVKRRQLR